MADGGRVGQTNLFDLPPAGPAAPFNRGSDTSREAAEAIEPHVQRLERIVLAAVRATGAKGATCDEVEAETGLSHQTASARVNALKREGRPGGAVLFATGRKRRTRSGRQAEVYVVEAHRP